MCEVVRLCDLTSPFLRLSSLTMVVSWDTVDCASPDIVEISESILKELPLTRAEKKIETEANCIKS